jgi:FkbM family methyltransferase
MDDVGRVADPAASAYCEMPTVPLAQSAVFVMQKLLTIHDIAPRGVIHLGGHLGEEILPYAMVGFETMLLVEPQPSVYRRLEANAAAAERLLDHLDGFAGASLRPRIETVQAAVGDHDGRGTLNVFRRVSFLSSMLEPTPELAKGRVAQVKSAAVWYKRPFAFLLVHWRLGAPKAVDVRLATLDTIMAELPPGWDLSQFNVLRMNIQGAELMALQGATRTLPGLELVFFETNLSPRYRGAPTDEQFDRLLAESGFRRSFAFRRGDVGNVAYTRQR